MKITIKPIKMDDKDNEEKNLMQSKKELLAITYVDHIMCQALPLSDLHIFTLIYSLYRWRNWGKDLLSDTWEMNQDKNS